jgi:hypothetical protein
VKNPHNHRIFVGPVPSEKLSRPGLGPGFGPPMAAAGAIVSSASARRNNLTEPGNPFPTLRNPGEIAGCYP